MDRAAKDRQVIEVLAKDGTLIRDEAHLKELVRIGKL
jgi:hypothetical protein